MSEDLHSLSGAYVLDALSEQERADFEVHLRRCATCREEVDSLREVAPLLAETVAVPPPPSLREDVLARARQTRQDPPPDEAARVVPLRRARRRWAALAAAAALVVGGGLTWQVVEQAGTRPLEQVASAPDARTWSARTATGGEVTVTRSDEVGRAVLRVSGLPDPGQGHAYQAWLLTDEGALAPAGMVKGTDGTLLLEGDVTQAKGVGVTLEPASGSPQPTTEPIALVELA